MLTGFHESLHTFERFQRQYSQGHNSNVKVWFFIFLWWQRDIHNKCNTVSDFSLFPIFRLTSNTVHGIAVSLRGALSGTLISFHANSFHVRACYCCWFNAFSLFVDDKTAFWTNMTTTPELAKTCIFGKTALSSLGIISQHLTKSHKYTSQTVKLVQVEISKKFFTGVRLHHRRRRLFIGKLGQ